MSRITMPMWNEQQGHQAIKTIWSQAKAHLSAGRRMVLTLAPETRSLKENAMLHAMLTYISKNLEWAGQKRDVDTWKRLLIAAWCRATGEPVELLPALDGMGVDIVFRRSSKLSRKECAELIEFIYAWGLQNDVHFPASKEETKLYEK